MKRTSPNCGFGDETAMLAKSKTVIIGAGPAGLTAAYELVKHNDKPLVLEVSQHVGGIARTEEYKGFRFDIGGHRFFTKIKEIDGLWHEVLGDEFIKVPRSSRIYFRGKFYDYPLQLWNAFRNLGVYESVRVLLSYLKWQVRPYDREDTFEQWVVNRFGGRLYWFFFRTYTEKVWGIKPSKIRSDWAMQRIKDLSLLKAVVNALTKTTDTSTLIKEFDYPRLGPGMMWQRFREEVEQHGGEVRLGTAVTGLRREGNRVVSVIAESADAQIEIGANHVISSMPLPELIFQLDPPPPARVIKAAKALKYRDFLIVTLILDKPDPFPDNWIYIHSPDVMVGRIQNFKSWSKAMVPDLTKSSLGLEYFCHVGDGLWTMQDQDLLKMATRELAQVGLAEERDVIDGTVIRQAKAYPVYDEHYKENVQTIKSYLSKFDNLQTVGRNGMHRYNNQDHSMLTALLAARNTLGEHHDLWGVNVERSYHEDFVTKENHRRRGEAVKVVGYHGPERRRRAERRHRLNDQTALGGRESNRRSGRDRRTADPMRRARRREGRSASRI